MASGVAGSYELLKAIGGKERKAVLGEVMVKGECLVNPQAFY